MSNVPPPSYAEAEPSKPEAFSSNQQQPVSSTQQAQPMVMMTSQPGQPVGQPPQPYVVQPTQYMAQPGGQPIMVHPYQPGAMMMMAPRPPLLPRELQPNDYFVITLVVAVACGLLNLTSLFFSVPAVICSAIAFERRSYGNYQAAKQLGLIAIILDLLCVAWVMVWGVIVLGLLEGCLYGVGDLCY